MEDEWKKEEKVNKEGRKEMEIQGMLKKARMIGRRGK